jgi:uncharacterized coiled-coil protein SlyX
MKKKNIKKALICLTLLTVILLAASCGGDNSSMELTSSAYVARQSPMLSATRFEGTGFNPEAAPSAFRDRSNLYGGMDEAASFGNDVITERKLARQAHLRIRVENLETADASVSSLMGKFNAYAASTSIEENFRHYSLRVPAHHYDAFLTEMNGLGRLLNRNESTEDVTLRYFDLEGRIATQRQLLRTFQSYLARANNIEEILAVEARIADLQFNIENTETQLRHLVNRVDYATIDISLLGPVVITPLKNITFGERIKRLFSNFGSYLATIAVIVVGFVVYGIPILILVGLFFWLIFGKVGLVRKIWGVLANKK